MSVEIVLMVPILVMFTLLVLAGGRYVSVRADIDAAARDAARAASFERSESAARAAALAAANASDVNDSFSSCEVAGIDGSFEAGGVITVTIRCSVDNRGLGLVGLSGSRDFTSSSSAPIDQYRRFG
ncbi:TadE/TadG family type IV pilus assembly protein [Aeromicrobium duanguangcaii]|uniref:Pilus assembly protein n=1 Tax=Aeromicrobium duanguangcaii TaxID=2968086 RepID=A0ABY5KEW4_9ACTN|nr:TadE/TadG family type IV pilus assembly protein [Aeromicrobium duanguangcaii]MCD9154995.1 pilus assembly protein [Aeromicrobium duanguangcaii]UUI67600.1 pilus assembly protein [Aeromicrobium duanguangcaii]